MIQGLNVQLTTKELSDILEKRIGYHKGRVALYEKQIKVLGEGEDIEEIVTKFSNASNNPIGSLNQSLKTHQKKVVYFEFVKSHLVPADTYLLDTSDLNTLEVTSY